MDIIKDLVERWIVSDDPDPQPSRLDLLDGVGQEDGGERASTADVATWLREQLVWAATPIEMSTRQWVRCLPPVPSRCPHWLSLRLRGVVHDAMTPAEVLAVAFGREVTA